MPTGSARVASTAIVCGCVSWWTTKRVRRRLRQTTGHRHRLGGGRRLVEQRCVRHLEAGQLGDRRLEVEQRLQATLADLRLVRRVGRVPRRVLEHVALDHARRDGGVVAHADQAGARLVLGGEARAARRAPRARCAPAGRSSVVVADRRRDRLVEQRLERVDAEHARASVAARRRSGPMWRRAKSSDGVPRAGMPAWRRLVISDSPVTRGSIAPPLSSAPESFSRLRAGLSPSASLGLVARLLSSVASPVGPLA